MSSLAKDDPFKNAVRDNIDVKNLLICLERKKLLISDKYLKTAARTIESWMKTLPAPDINELQEFNDLLIRDYKITLECYIKEFEDNQDFSDTVMLTDCGIQKVKQLHDWIPELKSEMLKINHTPKEAQNQSAPAPNIHDLLRSDWCQSYTENLLSDSDNLFIIDTPDMFNNKYIVSFFRKKDRNVIDFLAYIRENHVCDQTKNISSAFPNNSPDRTPTQDAQQDIQLSSQITTNQTTADTISNKMKQLFKKILLIPSVILSSTKLNKSLKAYMIELKPDCLANNVNFVESYLKLLPSKRIDEVEFALKLTYFDINNIQLYYDTLTNVDTKNNTNITSVALTLLQSPPYSTYVSNIDPNLAKNPSSKKSRTIDKEKGKCGVEIKA
ncbi:unnamed protein product [Didymodactylos carnosus]|uniref:Uncharacterized protein n=1 Tax=Didymodactylos carnosus TaxID=1234261 RepID=A0A8S2PAI5_9BILA|nr:unnamed protein product [Didymodactylos carnosus]